MEPSGDITAYLRHPALKERLALTSVDSRSPKSPDRSAGDRGGGRGIRLWRGDEKCETERGLNGFQTGSTTKECSREGRRSVKRDCVDFSICLLHGACVCWTEHKMHGLE